MVKRDPNSKVVGDLQLTDKKVRSRLESPALEVKPTIKQKIVYLGIVDEINPYQNNGLFQKTTYLYHLESRWRNSHGSWFIMAPY